jgi:LCP family protein required for cell wall assembly
MASSAKRAHAWVGLLAAGSAMFAAGSALLAVAATQHVMPGKLTPVQAVQKIVIPDPQTVFGTDHLRVLVVGLDYDYSARDIESSAHSRSDVIMAVNLDFVKHRIDELSVPRDMVATMPDGRLAKINEAQSEGGIRESESVVSQWLGVPGFDRYVVLRIDTMKDLINALGGVTVDVENSDALKGDGPNGPLTYDDSWGHLHVHLQPGVQHLDGDQAVGYARFRHDWCSDPCRILRQQQVIHAIADRIEGQRLNTLLHLQPLLAVLGRDVQTDLTMGEEISLAAAFAGTGAKDIVTAQVPYASTVDLPDDGDSIVADDRAKRALVAAMLMPPKAPAPVAPAIDDVATKSAFGAPAPM